MGFLAAPARDEVFTGWRGHGATLNGRPIPVSGSTRLNDGLLCIGMSPRISADQIMAYVEPLLRRGVVYYREGSGALSLAYVAAGRLIGYVEAHLNSWDGLAGVALVEAAGGQVNDFLAGDALWKGGPIVATSRGALPRTGGRSWASDRPFAARHARRRAVVRPVTTRYTDRGRPATRPCPREEASCPATRMSRVPAAARHYVPRPIGGDFTGRHIVSVEQFARPDLDHLFGSATSLRSQRARGRQVAS